MGKRKLFTAEILAADYSEAELKVTALSATAYVPQTIVLELLEALEHAGMGAPGSPNTLSDMVHEMIASRDAWYDIAKKLYGAAQCTQANPQEIIEEYHKLNMKMLKHLLVGTNIL